MPNWCYNTAKFTHKNPAMIARVAKGFNEGKLFGEFDPTPPELLEDVPVGENYVERAAAREAENEENFGHKDWYHWNIDNFGPITIPKKGVILQLNDSTLSQYRRLIEIYEGNKLEQRDGKIFINGKEATSYQCKMDYYWMMGDNRSNSADSRFWGFVPEDHIVGKAWFIWLSINYKAEDIFHKVRWSRLFTNIHNKWAPKD